MAFIVQDDTGLIEDANSYVAIQEFKDYWTDRNTDYTALSNAVIQSALIQSTSYIDVRYTYQGFKLNGYSQTTEFPRGDLWICSAQSNFEVEGIPREVKSACNEYAQRIVAGGDLQADENADGAVKKTKEVIGPLETEVEFFGGGSTGGFINYPTADSKIPKEFIAQSQNSLVRF